MVVGLAEQEIPFDPAKTADFFPAYHQALSAAVGSLGSKTKSCHLCLGGPAVFARILKLPVADPVKVNAMIGFEAQQTVPAIEQALWDFQLLSSAQPGETEALILAIKKETVEELTAAASAAGLNPLSVTLTPAALLNGFYFNYPEMAGSSLLLEIGCRATTIILVEGGRFFVRVVPLGGATVSQSVATDLQESFAGAEVLKKAKGFVHPGGAYEDPADAAAARISKLARGIMTRLHAEVERSVTFFRSQQGGGKPTQAWLTGGGAVLGYTDLFFREKLRIPVQFFQPFRRLALPAGPVSQTAARNFSGWGIAVGTALQALPDAPVRINVLGALGRAQAQKKKDVPAMTIALAAGLVLLLMPGLHGWWRAAKLGGQLAHETERVEEASRELQKLEGENKEFLATGEKLKMAGELQRERLRWLHLLVELQQRCPDKLWITRFRLLPNSEPAPGAGTPAPAAASPVPSVEIEGMFETQSEQNDANEVANFQKALEQGGILRNISVLERETPRYVGGKTDQVALKFRLKADWPCPVAGKNPANGGK